MLKRISGTKDILPADVFWWQEVERISREIFSLYNYQEIRTPLIEEAYLFNRSLGSSTEIVQKQMFLIKRPPDTYALRPEGTASIVRAYLENGLHKKRSFVKFYYLGPMFRGERPQKGRLRQFHHLGVEAIGSANPAVDLEIIMLADNLLKAFSIQDYKIKLNSLGCLKDKTVFKEKLQQALKGKVGDLCLDCQIRFKQNILRILDCKKPSCIQIVKTLKIEGEYLCPECNNHFQEIKNGLSHLKINYEISPYLVRGLDYYTRTVFEIVHPGLGSQDALGAGGRYDHLIRELGGPDTPAVGFAFGIERLQLVSNLAVNTNSKNLVYLISLGEAAKKVCLEILDNLRKAKIPADMNYQDKSLKGALRLANDLGARYVLLIGEDEINKGVVTLKDMRSGQQKEVKQKEIITELMSNVKAQNSK